MFMNKDQLAHYMIAGHVHLSKKDYGFFNNIKTIVHDNKPVTTNQDKLFNKLLAKYQRQLAKLNHNVQFLIELPWKVELLETKQEYLDAKISIKDNTITIKSPFNNKFIQMFRKLSMNEFVWNKTERFYEAPFSTYQLKIAVETVTACYESVTFCQETKNLLSSVAQYKSSKYWAPTLVKIQDNFYIVACNQALYDSISHIELNDDPNTLYQLSQYGINVDDSLLTGRFQKFAAEYLTEIDINDLHDFTNWLKQLNVECVFTSRDLVYNKELGNDLKIALLNKGISCLPAKTHKLPNTVLIKTHSSWTPFGNYINYNKIIHLTNSRPVKIR